mmetsp:Transcript_22427/g.45397  ORF Transcript_22427/g.45397 Transcript_22427/m.45397 type:complete len:200 (-) Transcript_22427:50-649(-)
MISSSRTRPRPHWTHRKKDRDLGVASSEQCDLPRCLNSPSKRCLLARRTICLFRALPKQQTFLVSHRFPKLQFLLTAASILVRRIQVRLPQRTGFVLMVLGATFGGGWNPQLQVSLLATQRESFSDSRNVVVTLDLSSAHARYHRHFEGGAMLGIKGATVKQPVLWCIQEFQGSNFQYSHDNSKDFTSCDNFHLTGGPV